MILTPVRPNVVEKWYRAVAGDTGLSAIGAKFAVTEQ